MRGTIKGSYRGHIEVYRVCGFVTGFRVSQN